MTQWWYTAGMPSKPCVKCSVTITGPGQKRYCDPCRKVRNAERSIRALNPGERIPPGEPRRYMSSHGYVRLRWLVGLREYVETYEHRVFGGYVTDDEHVHHLNHDRSDNRPENLRQMTALEHLSHHGDAAWHRQAADLYGQGWSTYQIARLVERNPATVYRAILKLGVKTRSEDRLATPNWEKRRCDADAADAHDA